MAMFDQGILSCKPCLWALFGVGLLGFGSVGLTTCTDGSKQMMQIATLEESGATMSEEISALTFERDQLSLSMDEMATEFGEKEDVLQSRLGLMQGEMDAVGGSADEALAEIAAYKEEIKFRDTLIADLKAEAEDYRQRDVANDDRVMAMRSSLYLLSARQDDAAYLADVQTELASALEVP